MQQLWSVRSGIAKAVSSKGSVMAVHGAFGSSDLVYLVSSPIQSEIRNALSNLKEQIFVVPIFWPLKAQSWPVIMA